MEAVSPLFDIYLTLSVIIGVLQVSENIKLYRQRGAQLNLDYVFATVEFIWFVVTVWALFKFSLFGFALYAAITFICFNVYGWGVGLYAALQAKDDPDAVAIPQWYFIISIPFALVYTALSVAAHFYV